MGLLCAIFLLNSLVLISLLLKSWDKSGFSGYPVWVATTLTFGFIFAIVKLISWGMWHITID